MIKRFQTKSNEVLIEPISQLKGRVILNIHSVTFDGSVYRASLSYTKENGEPIKEGVVSNFTKQEADYLFTTLQISGDTFTEKFVNLISGASNYQLEADKVLGLNVSDWEEFIEPPLVVVQQNEPTQEENLYVVPGILK